MGSCAYRLPCLRTVLLGRTPWRWAVGWLRGMAHTGWAGHLGPWEGMNQSPEGPLSTPLYSPSTTPPPSATGRCRARRVASVRDVRSHPSLSDRRVALRNLEKGGSNTHVLNVRLIASEGRSGGGEIKRSRKWCLGRQVHALRSSYVAHSERMSHSPQSLRPSDALPRRKTQRQSGAIIVSASCMAACMSPSTWIWPPRNASWGFSSPLLSCW